jgi:serine/threonine-protein kinase
MILNKGDKIGPYTILEPVKRGGMAQIYRAYQPDKRREVAVKVSLADGDSKTPLYRNALRREVDILTKLNHPGIIRVLPIPLHSVKEQPYVARAYNLPGQPWYYVMEFLKGGSVGLTLKEIKRFQLSLASAIGEKLADTLLYTHSHGVAHMDIKPENILMRYPLVKNARIEPVLIDFGVAAQTKQVSATGGTLITMAPEYIRKMRGQLAPEQKVDLEKVDIYALGVVVYRMWTGQFPFNNLSERSLTSAILNDTIRSPRDIIPELPRKTETLMEQWLSKDPILRPSLDEIRRELHYLGAGIVSIPETIIPENDRKSSGWQFWRK